MWPAGGSFRMYSQYIYVCWFRNPAGNKTKSMKFFLFAERDFKDGSHRWSLRRFLDFLVPFSANGSVERLLQM